MGESTVIERPRTQLIIERPRLTKLLDDAGARVMLLLAPAGYGKTTLAQQWTRKQERTGWYTGGRGMADVAGLSVGIADVLAKMGEPARLDMLERVRILAARGHDARGLAKAVSGGAPGGDWLLVVDDYHHAHGSADSEAFFDELVSLTGFRLLITSRERPVWLPARRVVYGEAAVVEMDALAFTDDEALQVMGGRGEDIVAEARGWPAVIGLAAMRGSSGVAAGLAPEELYRFFAEDLFSSASPELREAMFLLALAGVDGARVLLAEAHVRLLADAAERGFLTGEGSVVHPLLRGFLLAKLAELDDAKIRSLVKRAVEYLAGEHRWDDCLFVLEQFPQDDLILSTLERGLAEILDGGFAVSLSSWVSLGISLGLEDPVVALAEAELALRQRQNQRAHALGEHAAAGLDGDLAARAYLVAARAAHLSDDSVATRRLCSLVTSNARTSPVAMDALWLAFSSALEQVDADTDALLSQLRGFSASGAPYRVRLLVAEALLMCQRGRVKESISKLETARELISRDPDPFSRTNLLHHLSYCYLLAARYDDAHGTATAAIAEARETGLQFVVDYGLLRQAAAEVGRRRFGQAQANLDALERRALAASDFVLTNVLLLHSRLAIAIGDLERAETLLSAPGAGSARPAFRAEVRGYRAIIAASMNDIHGAFRLLGQETEAFRFVEPAALREVALAIVSMQGAHSGLDPMAVIEGLFNGGELDALVTGYRSYPSLARLALEGQCRSEMVGLLVRSNDYDVARSIGLRIPREARPREQLSPREREVYDLLVQGRTSREIAQALYISISTAKVHIRHIFEKLGVHSRAEAARLASHRDLG